MLDQICRNGVSFSSYSYAKPATPRGSFALVPGSVKYSTQHRDVATDAWAIAGRDGGAAEENYMETRGKRELVA